MAGGKPSKASFVCAIVLVLGSIETKAADKSPYTIFNPTPENQLRDLTTDRPDITESPFTIDAGHVQFETNVFGYSRSRPDASGIVSRSFEYLTTNIRVGITNSTELAVVVAPYSVVKVRSSNPTDIMRFAGPGGVDFRLKVNLWGNDDFEKPGATALALMPFITIPTDRNNGISPTGVEGGLIIPLGIKLSEKFTLGVNSGFHIVRNEDAPGTHTEWLGSASLSYEWTDKLSTYYEVAGRLGTKDPRGDIGILGTGFTYKLAKNVQLDAGVNFGITKAADRINPFVGVSARY